MSELQHHGVLGMHWGVRRYQPYGKGGYTPKDKERFHKIKQDKRKDIEGERLARIGALNIKANFKNTGDAVTTYRYKDRVIATGNTRTDKQLEANRKIFIRMSRQ